MAKNKELFSCKLFELKDVQLVHVTKYNPDTQKMESPKTIGYFRQPNPLEYPLDLGKGYEKYIHRDWTHHSKSPHDRVLHYLMQQLNQQHVITQTDFCINRKTMVKIIEIILHQTVNKNICKPSEHKFEAVRFKGCIFLNFVTAYHHNEQTPRSTYALKARQYLFADTPGAIPNTDVPVNENMQLYGIFSAKLGNFRLLYSGEVTGVENTEPLGDLNDPEVLKQCRLTSIKVFNNPDGHKVNWRTNWRITHWILQAHLSGIKQQRVAIFDNCGLVNQPIDGDGLNQLDWLNHFNMRQCTQLLHDFLLEIVKIMGDTDCPHTIYELSVKEQSPAYNGKKHKTNSSLTEEFIQFANRL